MPCIKSNTCSELPIVFQAPKRTLPTLVILVILRNIKHVNSSDLPLCYPSPDTPVIPVADTEGDAYNDSYRWDCVNEERHVVLPFIFDLFLSRQLQRIDEEIPQYIKRTRAGCQNDGDDGRVRQEEHVGRPDPR